MKVSDYLERMMQVFWTDSSSPFPTRKKTADEIFKILTSREFNYLGRSRSLLYKQDIEKKIDSAIKQGQPIQFYLDLGGGYHASLDPEKGESIQAKIGLGELLALYQIKRFSDETRRSYDKGVYFHLFIDNICAHMINDIRLEATEGYCKDLRSMIWRVNMPDICDVIVESELFGVQEYLEEESRTAQNKVSLVSDQDYDNVARFLGYSCSKDEAVRRIQRYKQVLEISESLTEPLFEDGIHLTQRATPKTLCFRSFPGGDSRIQCGQVALEHRENGKIVPFLLTSRNKDEYCLEYDLDKNIPQHIPYVTVASKA
jgi:hypothetical protein